MHGMLALVPSLSLTLTTIIGSPVVGAGADFFSFLGLSGGFSPPFLSGPSSSFFSNLSSTSHPFPNFLSTSLSLSLLPPSLRSGDLSLGLSLSCSLYPLSNLLSSLLPSLSSSSSSYRGFSFHRNPPPNFLGLSSCLRLGDLLRERCLRGGGEGE